MRQKFKEDFLSVGDKIKICRQRAKLTQRELAIRTDIHPVSIRKYETNKMQTQEVQIRKITSELYCLYGE